MRRPITIKREDTILTITFSDVPTDADHEAHLAELHAVMEDGKWGQRHRWVVINDLRVVVYGSAEYRRRQADWMKAHDDELRHRTSGVGFVMNSALMRGALTAVFWLAPLPCDHGVFATYAEARAWAEERHQRPIGDAARPPGAKRIA